MFQNHGKHAEYALMKFCPYLLKNQPFCHPCSSPCGIACVLFKTSICICVICVFFFLFLSCNSVRIHPLLLPYRMLPLLSLEQKGSGPTSSSSSCLPQLPPTCCYATVHLFFSVWLLLIYITDLSSKACPLLVASSCLLWNWDRGVPTDLRCIRAPGPLPCVCTMWGMFGSRSQSGFL